MQKKGQRRAPYGARGLKSDAVNITPDTELGRAPYGARGLKFKDIKKKVKARNVAPRMGRVD